MAMSKDHKYRERLVALCKKNNWYMVNWHGHFIHQLRVFKRTKRLDSNVYSAVFESFYDLVQNDEELYCITIGDDCTSWKDAYRMVMKAIKERM